MPIFALLTDENIQPEVVTGLRARGHDVTTVAEAGLLGASDRAVLARAFEQGRLVVSHDSDFGRLALRGLVPLNGIVFLRPGHLSSEFVLETWDALVSGPNIPTQPFIWVAERRDDGVNVRLRTLDLCLCCRAGTPRHRPAICPACGYRFQGNGWDGIDAHWRARHEDITSYEHFRVTLCPRHRELTD